MAPLGEQEQDPVSAAGSSASSTGGAQEEAMADRLPLPPFIRETAARPEAERGASVPLQ
ncbi:hypothetical protein [Streptomyces sp. NPDC001250]|uniref:hypothetical protein n=1 Tax=unclassified Streptomyces TaxID=2593676 RepID=UPI00332ECD29